MKKAPVLLVLMMVAAMFIGCKNEKAKPVIEKSTTATEVTNDGDTTIYGVMLDGGNHSLLLLTNEGDTLEFIENPDDTVEVVKGGKLAGDKFAVISYEEYGDRILRSAINLTSLLGNWKSLDKDFEIKEGGEILSNIEAEQNPWTNWRIYNGKLVLSKDTFEIIELSDSMELGNDNGNFVFGRSKAK